MPGTIANPENDPVNVDVQANSVNALVMTLEIKGGDATPKGIMVARVPVSMADFRKDSSGIVVEALDPNGNLVGRTSVADRTMAARDGNIVVLAERTISIVVPILSKPESIRITLPGLAPQPTTPVGRVIDDHCRDFPDDDVCSGAPPQDSPFFSRLTAGDP